MIRPLRDRIVVRPIEEPMSSVIQVVQLGPTKRSRGEVLAVGPLVKFDETYRPRTATDTQVGDVITFTDRFKFPDIKVDGETVLLLQEADVCFVEVKEAA